MNATTKTTKNYIREISISMKKSNNQMLKFQLTSSRDSFEFFRNQFDDSIGVYESVMVLYLDNSNNTIGWQKHSQGGLNTCLVDVRLIMATALTSLANGVVICHNHPSGSLRPSTPDDNITAKLVEAGKILDIRVLDHLIITEDNGYFSYADDGRI